MEKLDKKRISGAWLFFILNFTWTWLFWIPAALLSDKSSQPLITLLHFAGGIGPLLAALFLVYYSKNKQIRTDFWKRVFDFKRISLKWYLVIFLTYPLLTLLPALIDVVMNGDGMRLEMASRFIQQPLLILPFTLFILLFGPVPEELGWRGYALDRLQKKHTALRSSLIIGFFWASWHLPLFFIQGTYHHNLGVGTTSFWIFMIEPVIGSILYTWIYNNTHKSILSAILFHFMGNYTGELFNLSPRAEIVQCIATFLLTVIVVFYQGPKTLKKSATMVAFILLPLIASGYTPPPSNNTRSLRQFIQYCDNRIPHLMDQYDIPGTSIALVHAGKPVWSAAWGYADLEHNRKMMTDAICRVESISKSVTAWGVLNLVEKGLLDADAAVEEYLKNFKLPTSPYDGKKITIRTLLSNTSGMRLGTIGKSVEYEPHSDMPSLQEFLEHEVKLIHEPGSHFLYSNAGFNLLQLVVEQVSGCDYAAYMKEEILKPLGMNRSGFALPDTLLSSVPTGYDLVGTPVPVYVYPASASGGLFATAEDIARFVSAGMTGPYAKKQRVLEPQSINNLHTPQVEMPGLFGIVADAYGFEHFIENLSDGRKAVWQGGQGHGWMTHFHSVPASGDGIVILTNSQRSWPFIARVLSDWGKWCGLGRIKMGRITYGIIVMKMFIAIVVLLSLWLLFLLFRDWRKGSRRPDARPWLSKRQMLQLIAGLMIISMLIWCALQPYLMVESIFPNVVGYTGYVLLGAALILLASAFFRHTKN